VAAVYLQQLVKYLSCPKRTRPTNNNFSLTKINQRRLNLSVVAARLWNGLPQHLTGVEDTGAFRNGLKTWIFNIQGLWGVALQQRSVLKA
jgi:hypothetical protein